MTSHSKTYFINGFCQELYYLRNLWMLWFIVSIQSPKALIPFLFTPWFHYWEFDTIALFAYSTFSDLTKFRYGIKSWEHLMNRINLKHFYLEKHTQKGEKRTKWRAPKNVVWDVLLYYLAGVTTARRLWKILRALQRARVDHAWLELHIKT